MKISLSQLRQLVKEAKEEVGAPALAIPALTEQNKPGIFASEEELDARDRAVRRARIPSTSEKSDARVIRVGGHAQGAPDVYEPPLGTYETVLRKLQKGEPLDDDPATSKSLKQILNDPELREHALDEAGDISWSFLKILGTDPFLLAELTEAATIRLWRWLWPNDKVPILGKELLILLRERLKYVIAYSSEVTNLAVRGGVPIRTALAAAAKAVGPGGKTLAARAAAGAGASAGRAGFRQSAKAAVRQAGRAAALGPASIVLGAADIAILGVEHLGLDAMRASEYQSTLIKQMIDVHRDQYLYRKSFWKFDPDLFGGGEGETLPVLIGRLKEVIKEIETSLELRNEVNTNYTIMVPKMGEKRAETPWWEMETDIPGEKSEDKNFEIARRKLSDIPKEIVHDLRRGEVPDPLPKNWKYYKYLYDKHSSVLKTLMGKRWIPASAWIKKPDLASGKMQIWITGPQTDDIGLKKSDLEDAPFLTGKASRAGRGDYVETDEPQLRGRMRSSFDTLTYWTKLDYLDLTDKLRKAYRALAVAEDRAEKEQNVD